MITETRGEAGYLVSEANKTQSREEVTLAQDAVVYVSGTVLANNAGTYERFNGTNTAAAILYTNADATAGPLQVTITARDSEINTGELTWSGDGTAVLTDPQITAGTASLATAGILLR